MPQPFDTALRDVAAEKGLLVAFQQTPALVWQLAPQLRADFFTDGRGEIFTTIVAAAQAEQPVPRLVDADPAPDPPAAAARVLELAQARLIESPLDHVARLVGRVSAGTASINEVLSALEEATARARDLGARQAGGLTPAADLLGGVVDQVRQWAEHRAATGSSVMGLPTGFKRLDDLLNGLEPGLLVLGGAPGMGKTTLANLIAAHVAGTGTPVLYLTYENSRENLILKHLCRLAGEAETDARRGEASPVKLAEAAQRFAPQAASLYYVEAAADTTIDSIRGLGRQIRRRHGADRMLVIVDYLQKMAHTQGYDELRANVGATAARLRDLSRDLNAPVLALASLNRGGYKKNNEDKGDDPNVGHLKESGDIEYAADVVLLLSEREAKEPKIGSRKPVKLGIAKNRGGQSGTAVDLIFDAAIGNFGEMAPVSMVGGNGRNR